MESLQKLLLTPLRDRAALGIALVIALTFIAIPDVVRPNDWELNTADLWRGLGLYDNPNYVYPPWALILMQPYRLMTAAGARVLSVLVVIGLGLQRGWTLRRFLAVMANPFMIYAALFSNIDILVLALPVLLWEVAADWGRRAWVGRGLAIALMLLKPQGAVLLLPYLLWRERARWRGLIPTMGFAAALTVPISFAGSPPLLLQWIDNITNASPQNQAFWESNNMSLTNITGLPLALIIVVVVFGGTYWLLRGRWSRDHTYTVTLLSAMLLSPYTSHQSLIAALAFLPSWPATLLMFLLSFVAGALGLYEPLVGLWILSFGVVSLVFGDGSATRKEHEENTLK